MFKYNMYIGLCAYSLISCAEWNDGPPKVFILYHKDPRLEQTHGIKANNFMDGVTDMAHILHSVGGFELTIDLFEKGDIDHLMTWITQKVNESRYVVLLLSPGLSEALNDPKGKNQLEADRGSFFAKTVINLMGNSPGEFVPVFLSKCEDHSWIPTSLAAAPKYTLDVDALVDCIQVDSDDPTYYQRVQDAIQMQQFEQWGRLILHLRGQRHQQPPAPANPPIQIPTSKYMHVIGECTRVLSRELSFGIDSGAFCPLNQITNGMGGASPCLPLYM